MRLSGSPRREFALDVGFYLVSAVFAAATAVFSEFYGYRIWGALAGIAYLVGLIQAVLLFAGRVRPATGRIGRVLTSRMMPVWLTAGLGMVLPLVVLLIRRLQGVAWSEQPEVWVIEQSATRLLHTGSPYTDLATLGRPPIVDDYTPYGVAMSVFGIPRALFGISALTDARVAFGLFSALIVFVALRVLRRPKVPIRAAQLILACPLTTLVFAVAGDDLVIVALILLALALLYRRRPVWCGGVIAVAVSIKLTASPALIVLAVAVFGILGLRSLLRFCAAVIVVGIAVTVPVMLIDPHNFVEQVIKFPLGIGIAHSPAQSPLPGVLIGQLGPAGHDVALALMCAVAVGIGCWLVIRPPRSASDAALRSAIGLGLAILLSPATRYGYLIYPLALFGAAITLRAMENQDTGDDSAAEDRLEVGEAPQLGLAFQRPLVVEGRPVRGVGQ
ncbi:MAG TPA: glycosyltransferase 87 family protein [Pseudonocardiaceae bacterium]